MSLAEFCYLSHLAESIQSDDIPYFSRKRYQLPSELHCRRAPETGQKRL